jgi:hypothetical protein
MLQAARLKYRSTSSASDAAIAAPIVGENNIGIRISWRSFQAAITCHQPIREMDG